MGRNVRTQTLGHDLKLRLCFYIDVKVCPLFHLNSFYFNGFPLLREGGFYASVCAGKTVYIFE